MENLFGQLLEDRRFYRSADDSKRLLGESEVRILAKADLYRRVANGQGYGQRTRDKAARRLTNLVLSGAYKQALHGLMRSVNNTNG